MRYAFILSSFAFVACSQSEAPPAQPPAATTQPAPPAAPAPEVVKKEEPVADTRAAAGPGVSFAKLLDGATITNGFELGFVVQGKTVNPAGDAVDDTTKGHHHLIIDGKGIDAQTPVPADATHIHFGKGQINHVLNVAPGQHTLTLQFADGAHRSYGPDWSKTITVTVTAAAAK
jgi:hypothetical protein